MALTHFDGVSVGPAGLAVGRKGHLSIPVIRSDGAQRNFRLSSRPAVINLSGGNVTLSLEDCLDTILIVSVGHATNAIVAPAGVSRVFVIVNRDATLVANIRVVDQGAPVAIAANSTAMVFCDTSVSPNVYRRLTPNA